MNRSTAKWIGSTIQCRHCNERVNQDEVGKDYLCRPCHQLAQLFPTGESNRRRRGHAFVTSSMLKTIPALYATEDTSLAEKTLHAHYFLGACDWYVAELDPETGLAFGHADLGMGFPEWGYFNLVELEQTVVHGWLVIERDLHFTPCTTLELGIA
jgi:hypothetical protein